jgi:hypothetical protein
MDRGVPKLPVEPGEYTGECWRDRRKLSAFVKLIGNQNPSVALVGNLMPRRRRQSFPELVDLPRFAGRLHSNQEVVFRNARVRVWFDRRANAEAELAVVGLGARAADKAGFTGLIFQTTNLPLFFGHRPWIELKFPAEGPGSPGTYSATTHPDLDLVWRSGTWTVTAKYQLSLSLNTYNHGIPVLPVICVDSRRPVDALAWWSDWIEPCRSLVALATYEATHVTSALLLSTARRDAGDRRQSQLFRHDVSQTVEVADSPSPLSKSAFTLATLGRNFADIVLEWQQLRQRFPDFLGLLLAVVTNADRHLRARFLYLVQAAEELHRARYEDASAVDDFKRDKRAVLARLRAASVGDADLKWLKRSLPSRPIGDLAARLRQLRNDLGSVSKEFPTDFPEEVRSLRNRLSHGSEAAAAEEIARRCLQVEALCVGQVFLLLGLPADAIASAVAMRRDDWTRIRDEGEPEGAYATVEYVKELPPGVASASRDDARAPKAE